MKNEIDPDVLKMLLEWNAAEAGYPDDPHFMLGMALSKLAGFVNNPVFELSFLRSELEKMQVGQAGQSNVDFKEKNEN